MATQPQIEQIVVANGVIVGIHKQHEDIYSLYPHDGTYAWFDFNQVLVRHNEVPYVQTTNLLNDGIDPVSIQTPVTIFEPKTAVPDPRLSMTLSDAQAAVISMLTRIANHEILTQYSLQVQILVERLSPGYTAQNRTDMHTFIDGKLAALATKTAAVQALGTVAAVIAYNVWA